MNGWIDSPIGVREQGEGKERWRRRSGVRGYRTGKDVDVAEGEWRTGVERGHRGRGEVATDPDQFCDERDTVCFDQVHLRDGKMANDKQNEGDAWMDD